MNSTSSIRLVNERFPQSKEAGPNIIRAEERYNERPVGVYYFDFSEVISDPQFDLNSYLQKTVATDYYQNEGSLQWNYYLYFVLDKGMFQSLQESGRVSAIELDRTFARKFVRDEKWFAEDLKANLSASLYSAGQPKDIASHWVEELTKAGLGRIADPKAAYTTIVGEFLRTTTRAASVSKNADSAKQTVPDGKHLEYLEIKKFRKFPLVRKFNFGKVS